MAARPSEIRSFLLRYAIRRGIRVQEHVSEPEGGGLCAFFCHLSAPPSEPMKSVTAVSHEHHDNALTMAFLQWGNHELTFLPEDV
jgi:hypothetical protein